MENTQIKTVVEKLYRKVALHRRSLPLKAFKMLRFQTANPECPMRFEVISFCLELDVAVSEN
jgi:hypothetical protein